MKSNATKRFFKEAAKEKKLSGFQKIHAYIYGRWLYFYIAVGTGEHFLCKLAKPFVALFNAIRIKSSPKISTKDKIGFADTYHGKVVTTKNARQLVTLNQKIDLRNLEQVIPYKRAKDIVLTNPEHIIALDCPCRTARKNPCKPLDVCLVIGEPFASFVLEHHPNKARRITSTEAEQILEDEHKRGHVHHAFFKDVMIDRFYAICNCCKCCCGAMQANRNGTPMLSSSGFVCTVDEDKCIGCGLCAKLCQFEAITISSNKLPIISPEKCMGCGSCMSGCKPDALSLSRDTAKSEPLEIHRLLDEAAKQQIN